MLLAAAVPNAVLFDWLPPALMLGGVIVLGVMIALAVRGQNSRMNDARQSLARSVEKADVLLQQIEDVRVRAGELIGTAQRLVVKIEERTREFEELLLHAEQHLVADVVTTPISPATREVQIETKPQPVVPHSPLDPLARSVYELSDAGLTPVDIAQHLKEQIGKVELILALRKC